MEDETNRATPNRLNNFDDFAISLASDESRKLFFKKPPRSKSEVIHNGEEVTIEKHFNIGFGRKVSL